MRFVLGHACMIRTTVKDNIEQFVLIAVKTHLLHELSDCYPSRIQTHQLVFNFQVLILIGCILPIDRSIHSPAITCVGLCWISRACRVLTVVLQQQSH